MLHGVSSNVLSSVSTPPSLFFFFSFSRSFWGLDDKITMTTREEWHGVYFWGHTDCEDELDDTDDSPGEVSVWVKTLFILTINRFIQYSVWTARFQLSHYYFSLCRAYKDGLLSIHVFSQCLPHSRWGWYSISGAERFAQGHLVSNGQETKRAQLIGFSLTDFQERLPELSSLTFTVTPSSFVPPFPRLPRCLSSPLSQTCPDPFSFCIPPSSSSP